MNKKYIVTYCLNFVKNNKKQITKLLMSDKGVEGNTNTVERYSKLIQPLNNINRVEVIDAYGRSYVNWDDKNKVEVSIQDNGRTLKIFIITSK